ncbi:MAG: sulfite exporter TauE/SafE family protein [Burkholderiaceae bacterium]
MIELLLLGSVAGFLAGLLGIGGGAMLVPVMTLVLPSTGMPAQHIVKMAVATSLATICFTSLASLRAHHRRGAVHWDVVKLLAPGIVLGSLLGAQIAKALPSAVLATLFAVFLAFSATQIFFERKPRPGRRMPQGGALFGSGSAIGVIATLVGAGGAFMTVPLMVACNVPIINAIATSAALGFPVAVAGTLGYIIAGWSLPDMPAGAIGYLYLPALFTLAAASMLAAPWGARAAHRMNVRQLRRAFACLLLTLALYMLAQAASF